MLKAVAYFSLALATLLYLLDWLISLSDDSREPPRIKPRIPLIGHALNLVRRGGTYYTKLSNQTSSEIYTLGFFNLKIYVTNSKRLIPLVQRQYQSISFTPFLSHMLKSFVGASDFSVNLYKDKNFLQELQRVNNTTLGPGPALDYQNLRANNSINELIDQTLEHGSVKIGLYMWIRHIITIGATDGVFGTSNPFLKQKNRDIFWEWQTAALPLWAGLDVFVPKQVKAREQLVKALANYHRGDHSDAAEVTKQRAAVHQRHGCPEEDIARIHLAFSQGVLPNTVPTAFWMVFEVFSRPQLLQRLRLEIMEHAVHVDKPIQTIELDVAALKTRCSLLLACLEETQRTRGQHATIRKVQEDTMVGPFLLKKNAYLQIPSQTVHFDPTIWGDDPYRFNPDRFLDMYASPRSASSFTAWGVAPHLCPARQFAATEILVLIALLVLRVDIEPIAGEWRELRVMKNAMTTILPPEEGNDFDVELVPRDGWQGNWMLKMGESRTKVPLFSG